MRNYIAILHKDKDSDYGVSFPDFPGCITAGSTLDEATSWGKISKKAMKAMAFVEPSVSLPLLVGYTLQKNLAKNRKPLKLSWDNDILTSLK